MRRIAKSYLMGVLSLLLVQPVRAVPSANRVQAGIEVTTELPDSRVYAGDPLLIRLRLSSPRAQQLAYLATISREAGKEPTASTNPVIAADWTKTLEFTMWMMADDGKRTVVLEKLPWAKYAMKQNGGDDPTSLVHKASWLLPAEIADLKAGRYVMQARWQGKGLVGDTWLDGADTVTGKEMGFTVQVAQTDEELAAHAGHLANADYFTGNYEDARVHGDEALAGMPDMLTAQRISLSLLVVNSAIALKDYADAAERLQKLLDILPPPEQNDMTVALRAQAEALRQIIAKTTPVEEGTSEEATTPEQ